jgi:hypothetical protein
MLQGVKNRDNEPHKERIESSLGGICMKGSIWKENEKDGERFRIGFYYKGKQHKIDRYFGEKIYHRKIAEKCLSEIQARYQQYKRGECDFRIEEFTGKNWTNVIEYFEKWLKTKKRKKPLQ